MLEPRKDSIDERCAVSIEGHGVVLRCP